MESRERTQGVSGAAWRRVYRLALLPVLALVLGGCAVESPIAVQVSFASGTYDGVAGYGVRVVVRLDRAPGRTVEIPLRVSGASEQRLWEWRDVDGAENGGLHSVTAVSFGRDETEKPIFLETSSPSGQLPSPISMRLGTLPRAVEAGTPSSTEVTIHAAPESELATINNLVMPHPTRADREGIGTLDVGEVLFAEFAFGNDNFASTTAMSWKHTDESDDSRRANVDTRLSFLQIVETDDVRLQIPVDGQCPDRKIAPPRSRWPCVIDDISDTDLGLATIRDSNYVLQARLGAGTYQLRVEPVSMSGSYRVTINFNEQVECYQGPCPEDDD